jgi:hypothetical protein
LTAKTWLQENIPIVAFLNFVSGKFAVILHFCRHSDEGSPWKRDPFAN